MSKRVVLHFLFTCVEQLHSSWYENVKIYMFVMWGTYYPSCFLTWRPILLYTVNHLSPCTAASSPWCPKHTPSPSLVHFKSSLFPSLYHVWNTHTCFVPKWIGLNHMRMTRFEPFKFYVHLFIKCQFWKSNDWIAYYLYMFLIGM